MMQQIDTSELSDGELKHRATHFKIKQTILQSLGSSMVFAIGSVITGLLLATKAFSLTAFLGFGGVGLLAVGFIYLATRAAVEGNELDHEEQARKIHGVSKGLAPEKAREQEIGVALTPEPAPMPTLPITAQSHQQAHAFAGATPSTTISDAAYLQTVQHAAELARA